MQTASTSSLEVLWRVSALHLPTVTRHCARCDQPRVFRCAERFRINGNGRRLDMWLLYRCVRCSRSWKLTLFDRVHPNALPTGLLIAAERNDPQLVRRFALNAEILRRAGVHPNPIDVQIDGPCGPHLGRGTLRARFLFSDPIRARLDRLLAQRLGVSRSCITKWWARQWIRPDPEGEQRMLRRPTVDGQRLLLQAAHIWPAAPQAHRSADQS